MVRLECYGKGRGRRSSRAGAVDGWGRGRGKLGGKARSQAESGFG